MSCIHNNYETYGFYVVYYNETEVFNYCIHDACMTCGNLRHIWGKLYHTSLGNVDKHRVVENNPDYGGFCCENDKQIYKSTSLPQSVLHPQDNQNKSLVSSKLSDFLISLLNKT